jgi:3-hydroxybutyryl-CoA dehydrogenase
MTEIDNVGVCGTRGTMGAGIARDMDLACRMGFGYPDRPIKRVERGCLAHHHEVTQALFEVYGASAYAPARRAVVAKRRGETS